ncbi:general stress protein [Sphingomonas sp. H160509]|uniref:general stress protein n=1 Tax=Sphingomonas sp. H160509 TaxID=2955313 RepID=UPI0020980CAE|nr:general stress protein [Sphingomonas sp. H160509]MDD1452765.1 general stress protein [Sphingomonas sp. H160509]
MSTNLVSAVFDNHADAERAVDELRAAGINDSAISIVAQHDGKNTTTDGNGDTQEFVGKVAAGAGIGTLLGIAAPRHSGSRPPSLPLARLHPRPSQALRSRARRSVAPLAGWRRL